MTQPFPWHHLLEYLSRRLTPGSERVESQDGGSFVRRLDTQEIPIRYNPEQGRLIIGSPVVSPIVKRQPVVTGQHAASGMASPATLQERATTLFDIRFDAAPMQAVLGKSALLRPLLAQVPGMRPPAAWSAFELCLRTVIGQQVSVAAAATLMHRLSRRCGDVLTPQAVCEADLSAIGMPARRVACLKGLARAITHDGLVLEGAGMRWEDIDAALKALPGFGPWTRNYLAIRLGRQRDAFPETDIGLLRAAGAASPAELLRQADRWRPWRAHAAIYLWSVSPRR